MGTSVEGMHSPVGTGERSKSEGRKRPRKEEFAHHVEIESSGGSPTASEPSQTAESSSDDLDSTSDTSSEEVITDEDPEDDTVEVTLEFFDPRESDFHGLKALLQSYLDGQAYACTELVELIIKQSTVGTVVKSGGQDPVGILTVLNIERHKDLESIAQIKAYVLRNCKEDAAKALFEEAWNRPRTGIIVSERLINAPPQLAPPLQQALFDEVGWATEDETTQELRDNFKFEHFITLSRIYADSTAVAASQSAKGKKLKKQETQLLVYARPEDEFFHKHCTWSFTFATGKAVAKDELEPLRLVMLLTKAQATAARRELDSVVGNAAAGDA